MQIKDLQLELNATPTESVGVNMKFESLAEEKLGVDFLKHGIYYRNLHGIVHHAQYHLGQTTRWAGVVMSFLSSAEA